MLQSSKNGSFFQLAAEVLNNPLIYATFIDMETSDSQQAILRALAHFDQLDYPLTLLELLNYSGCVITAGQLTDDLASLRRAGIISEDQGLYFLAQRQQLAGKRRESYRLALGKWRKAERFGRLLGRFPFVRAVAVYSSLAHKNPSADSDIDLFIIARQGRLWTARFFINCFLKIFRLRPQPALTQDKICVSYLAAENQLDLSPANFGLDWFNAYSCSSFAFIYDAGGRAQQFFAANNWLKELVPNFRPPQAADNFRPAANGKKILERLAAVIKEEAYLDFQKSILPKKYWAAFDGKKVIISNGQIKLHENSKKDEHARRMAENYQRLKNYADNL